ncbi:hypothetical protein ACKKBG_A24440 [Auxenochlorella protothecoides x Auxenochlorella symbiontica]
MGVHRRGSAPGHDLMRWPPPASAIVSVLKSKMTPVMSQPRLDCRHALACTPIRPSSLRSIPFTLRHRTPAGPRHTDPRSGRRVRHVVRAGQATPPPRSDPTPSGRTFIFAVDGTRDAEEGLRWLIRAMTKKGDTVHLAHVVSNPRTPFSGLNRATTSGTWGGPEDAQFMERVESEAAAMLAARYVPIVKHAGVAFTTCLLRLTAGRSAAAIGELLAGAARDLAAGLLVIASHGPGVLADYGSVARWCQDHSPVPVLLLPPAVLGGGAAATAAAGQPPVPAPGAGATLLVAGPAGPDLGRLHAAFDFAVRRLARPGDGVLLVNVVAAGPGGEGALVAARRELLAAAGEWKDAAPAPRLAATLNLNVDVLADASGTTASFDEGGSRAGTALCALAARSSARAVVLLRHGKDLSSELQFAPLTSHTVKHCVRPLVVYDVDRHAAAAAAAAAGGAAADIESSNLSGASSQKASSVAS